MEQVNVWNETLVTMMTTLWGKVAGFLPQLFAAIVILVVGYFVAKLIDFLLSKGLTRAGFDKLSDKVGVSEALKRATIKLTASDIVGKLAFWLIMLTFLVTATETLGLPRVSETLDEFVLYLPRVIGAALVLIIGLFLAHFVRDLIRSGAEGMGVEYAKPLSSAVFGLLFIVILSLSVNQLEIETGLLDTVIAILLATMGIAAALSLGLGTRDLSSHILAGVYARDLYQVGDKITLDKVEGTLLRIGAVKTEIKLKDKVVISVANGELINNSVSVKK